MDVFSLYFMDVDDSRTGNAKRHDFREIVIIALLLKMCGGQTCFDIADFAANDDGVLRRFMALEHRAPSQDTFSRLFRLLGPKAIALLAADWVKALEEDGGRQIATDGKALRWLHMRAGKTSPLRVVGTFLPEADIVLG